MPVLSSRPPRQTEKAAKCPEPLCPTRVLPPLGRRDPSPERTLLLRLRSYRLIRRSRWALSSLRLLASFGESLQVVTSPCCPRQLPDVISNSLFLDAGSPTPAVHRVLSPVSSTMSSAFPSGKVGRLPAIIPLETTSCGGIFEVADISLCSGLQVCSPPRSSLPLRILPQGSRGFYVRAKRGSLPPRASDMLTARRQAIGGTGTCTPLDCGLVGYSFPPSKSPADRGRPRALCARKGLRSDHPVNFLLPAANPIN